MKRHSWVLGLVLGALLSSLVHTGMAQTPAEPASVVLLKDYDATISEFGQLLSSQNGFQSAPGEDLKDSTAFILAGASARSGVPLLDKKFRLLLRSEFLAEAAIWCWLPGIPPDIKEKNRARLRAVRRPLVDGGYARSVISLTSGTTQTIGDKVTVLLPIIGGPEPLTKMAWGASRKGRISSSQLLEMLRKGDIDYNTLLNFSLLRQYLRIP